jgi:all-trans-retinol 13,14-reductase
MDENAFDVVSFDNDENEYAYANGYDNFRRTIIEKFPKEKLALEKYTAILQEISNSLPLFNFEYSNNVSPKIEYITHGISDFLDSITKNERLKNVLAGTNMLYAGEKNKTPIYAHSVINNSFINSSYKFNGGSEQIANELANSIKSFGGTILTRTEVNKLEITERKIDFAQTTTGEKFFADNFISNIHPKQTFGLISREKVRKSYYNRVVNVENTISYFNLYITLKENSFEYKNSNYFHYKENNVWVASSYSIGKWPQFFMFIPTQKNANDKYANGVNVITYMKFEEVQKWADTSVNKRGDEYLAFKHKKEEQFLDAIELKLPNFRKHIKNVYSSTPLTVRDYIGCGDGSMYGIMKNFNNPLSSYFTPKTKVPNLLLTGQNTVLHGVLGVTIGSVLTSSEVLGLEYLFNKIRNTI